MRLTAFLALAFLAACAVREQADFVDGTAPGASWQSVLVATTRAPDPGQPIPGWGRSQEVTFGQYQVSIPAHREPGEISRPRGRQAADPQRHFMLAEAQPLSASAFRGAIAASLNDNPPDQRETVIFVHGFNTTFVEGVYRAAQLGHDLQLPGTLLHYSWPSLGAPLAYAYDRDSALFARDGLIQMMRQARAAGSPRTILIAHSMGSHLVIEVLRQLALTRDPLMAQLGGVVLISPDVDIELFRQSARDIGTLPQPFYIITSQRDRVLTLSARMTGETSRLGNLASPEPIEGLGVTMVDVSAFSQGAGHFTVGSSPALIGLFSQMQLVNLALADEASGSMSLLPATILTLQNTTQVILQPMTETRTRRILPWWRRGAQPAD